MKRKKVLIVEDDAIAGIDVQAALERTGYDVAGVADSGEAALAFLNKVPADLVLMDIQLAGDLNGGETARIIAQRFDSPVVFLSVYADDAILEKVKKTGPFAFLIKPVDDRELRTAIEVALYRHGMERELRCAKSEAEAANEAKTSFLATISHELRTPLNGVLGMSDLLLQADLEKDHQEGVQLIRDASSALLGVLNQILDYSKLEAGAGSTCDVDFRLEELISGLAGIDARAREARGVQFNYDIAGNIPKWFFGDASKLRQALVNLVSNAVKFTTSGNITVSVRMCRTGEGAGRIPSGYGCLLFSVTDTGPGISEEYRNNIFESFTQEENYMTRHHGGLGLGLAIARKIVEVLGGDIWVESEEGKGCTFYFSANLQVSQLSEIGPDITSAEYSSDALFRGLRVLVAEDDTINQLYIRRILESRGCIVEVVDNGRKAVDFLSEHPCDMVLMDIQMPVMDGLEAARSIRSSKEGINVKVPILALTAYAMWGDRERCLASGMDAYLAKPVDVDTLLRAIEKSVRTQRSGQSF